MHEVRRPFVSSGLPSSLTVDRQVPHRSTLARPTRLVPELQQRGRLAASPAATAAPAALEGVPTSTF